mgnify:CR=1 FL=1
MTYFVHRKWIFSTPRVGFYNNHIRSDFEVYRGDGRRPVPTRHPALPYLFGPATTDTLYFLTQRMPSRNGICYTLDGSPGYRVVVATGMGLADHLLPAFK